MRLLLENAWIIVPDAALIVFYAAQSKFVIFVLLKTRIKWTMNSPQYHSAQTIVFTIIISIINRIKMYRHVARKSYSSVYPKRSGFSYPFSCMSKPKKKKKVREIYSMHNTWLYCSWEYINISIHDRILAKKLLHQKYTLLWALHAKTIIPCRNSLHKKKNLSTKKWRHVRDEGIVVFFICNCLLTHGESIIR